MSASASETFDNILECVKTSNLNFCLQLSPFSANISLKKTFIRDKAGIYLSPPVSDSSLQQNKELVKKVNELETIIDILNLRLEKSQTECEQLENKLKIKKEKTESEQINIEESYRHQL